MPGRRPIACAALGLLTAACGASSSPVAPPGPRETYDVEVVVFLDENGNGTVEAGEGARVPEAEVVVGGRSGRTERVTGHAVIQGVPEGAQTVSIRAATLPPYYAAGRSVTLRVPQSGAAYVPVTLPVGTNQPYEYMAFGDSITVGDTASNHLGYRFPLQEQLRGYFGRGNVPNRGVSASRSDEGAERIAESLERMRPAFTLILYGTNDWNNVECKNAFPCYTLESLRAIVRACRDAQSLPVLGTIPPVNPAEPRKAPPERQKWVADMNVLIRDLSREEGIVLADVHAALMDEGDLTQLFVDHVHPNDRGYEIIAGEFFRAITTPAGGGSADLGAEDSPHGAGMLLGPELLERPAPVSGRRRTGGRVAGQERER